MLVPAFKAFPSQSVSLKITFYSYSQSLSQSIHRYQQNPQIQNENSTRSVCAVQLQLACLLRFMRKNMLSIALPFTQLGGSLSLSPRIFSTRDIINKTHGPIDWNVYLYIYICSTSPANTQSVRAEATIQNLIIQHSTLFVRGPRRVLVVTLCAQFAQPSVY